MVNSVPQMVQYPDVEELLNELLSGMQKVLGEKLVGLYLYGSLVWGDFDYEISDIDLLAAISSEVNDREFEALKKMHNDIAAKYEQWAGRIEAQYLTLAGLKTFKTQTTKMPDISPGEPFHWVEAGRNWLLNWYFVQEKGITLFGPSPRTIIEPISKEEYLQAVKDQVKWWQEAIKTHQSRLGQSYSILTLSRAYYAYKNSEQVSKRKAAIWVAQQFPEWSALIETALSWRIDYRNQTGEYDPTYPQTLKFANFIIDQTLQN